jgi:hypothetical protein
MAVSLSSIQDPLGHYYGDKRNLEGLLLLSVPYPACVPEGVIRRAGSLQGNVFALLIL